MTVTEVKEKEIQYYRKAFEEGTDKAWKQYRANVKKMVTQFNKTHAEKIDINLLTA